MEKKKIGLVRGFRDLIKEQGNLYSYVISICRNEAYAMGFDYANLPLVEFTELFKRGMESSDLVHKEMFLLQNNEYCLRPEITASAMRSLMESGDSFVRMMYDGPCFRYERPQKGRYRQFSQFGCEFIGEKFAEFDMFILLNNIMKKLNISYKLIINDIGTLQERKNYELKLKEYVAVNYDKYSQDSKKRFDDGRYLRILDSKIDVEINKNAPRICDFIENKTYFNNICDFLKFNNIEYEINYNLVRGLDYYCGIVFEIISEDYKVDSQQIALGGGGRYDGLGQCLGAKQIHSSCGFALGVDRFMECTKFEDIRTYKVIILKDDYCQNLLNEISKEKGYINLGPQSNLKKFRGKIEEIVYVCENKIERHKL